MIQSYKQVQIYKTYDTIIYRFKNGYQPLPIYQNKGQRWCILGGYMFFNRKIEWDVRFIMGKCSVKAVY
jgi:hypothetical protein